MESRMEATATFDVPSGAIIMSSLLSIETAEAPIRKPYSQIEAHVGE